MKLYSCIKIALLMVTLGANCLGLDNNVCKDLIEKREASPIIKDGCAVIESIMIVQKYGNTPIEYSAAAGIMNFYNRADNPVSGVIVDQALNAKDSETKFNKDFVKYDSFIREQEKKDLKEVSKIRASIGFSKITNNAALALFLFNQHNDLSKAINVHLKDFLLNSKIEVIKPTAEIVISSLDNNVPFILKSDKVTYLCLGYIEENSALNLIIADMNEVTSRKYSGIIEGLEQTKTMKDRKMAEYWRKHYEEKIKEGIKVFSYLDYVFKLQTASDKPYIKTIKWMPSPDQSMTIIYPPKCDKKALQKCLEENIYETVFMY